MEGNPIHAIFSAHDDESEREKTILETRGYEALFVYWGMRILRQRLTSLTPKPRLWWEWPLELPGSTAAYPSGHRALKHRMDHLMYQMENPNEY